MKKLLIAVLAFAGLASCTNSEVEFEPQQKQIGLSPITQNRTRAMVDGTDFLAVFVGNKLPCGRFCAPVSNVLAVQIHSVLIC